MILSHGTEEVYENKEKITRFKFLTSRAPREKAALQGRGPRLAIS